MVPVEVYSFIACVFVSKKCSSRFSLVSASGCIFLCLCYFDYRCGGRLRLYFELSCLICFSFSAILEIAYGFCPAG